MPTPADIARAALAAVDSHEDVLIGAQWVNERLQEAAAHTRFRFLRDVGAVYIPAAIQTGVATFTRDSEVVTGDADAMAAWNMAVLPNGAGVPLVGRWIMARGRVGWYEITGFNQADASLRLRVPYTENTTASSYIMVTRYVSTGPGVRHLGPFVFQRLRWPITTVTLERLTTMAPERQYFSYGPTIVSEVGEYPDGEKKLEFWPYSQNSEVANFVFWRRPKEYAIDENLPGAVDTHLLKEGILVDVYRLMKARALRAKDYEGAATWGNHERAQMTVWSEKMELLTLNDHGIDDRYFILAMGGELSATIPGDIRTASDWIYSRGNRP